MLRSIMTIVVGMVIGISTTIILFLAGVDTLLGQYPKDSVLPVLVLIVVMMLVIVLTMLVLEACGGGWGC